MSEHSNTPELLDNVISIAVNAGREILAIYESPDFKIETKEDNSPVTAADHAADKVIEEGLKQISDFDVISEEGVHQAKTDQFWLVDPLDGTKEFIKRNGEFTVNIGLVKDDRPVLGVVYVPAKDIIYAGAEGHGAYKIESGKKQKIESAYKQDVPTIIASRSHRDENLDKVLKDLGEHQEISMGSSLKLCLIAEGVAQVYPRLAPTYLWDTCAADAVVRAAGGRVQGLDGQDLVYAPIKNLKNPFFIASTKNDNLAPKFQNLGS